jgi:hypothetical protein
MHIPRYFVFAAFLGGICLVVAGAYDVFIQATARQTAEIISISELQKNLPWNRHLIVTGGTEIVPEIVQYCKYKNRYGRKEKIPNSEIYFIPIQDSSVSPSASVPPSLVVRMTEEQGEKVKAQGGFPETRIEGVRMTHWDLESKAKEVLVSSFGKPAVEKMVVLDYQHEIVGIWRGLGQMLGGFVLLGAMVLWPDQPRPAMQQRPSLPPLTSVPARMPPPPKRRRRVGKRMAFGVIGGAIVLVLCAGLLSNWKQSLRTIVTTSGDDWADWQLPIRIGDSLEAVRDKLGQESTNESQATKNGDEANRGSQTRDSEFKYWREKGLSVFFENGRVSSIDVYTSGDQKYDGAIVAGVTAVDRLEGLLTKLGKPSQIADFNRNDKDYLWRRKAYAVRTRIAMEDLVTAGRPFKAHEMEGVLSLEDIAPYLQADRDKQLRRERLEKEKALVALTGTTLSPSEIFKKYSGRVVEVQAVNSKGAVVTTGTGFVWRGTEVLTNYHVVAQARSVRVKRGEDVKEGRFLTPLTTMTANRSHYSSNQDWIQLFLWAGWAVDLELPPVACSNTIPEVGESITVIGNPEGLTKSLSTGIVSGIREVRGNEWIQITAPISHGSSGSPVFDSKGRLIGLATMMVVDGQNLNFATPITEIDAGVSGKEVQPEMLPLESVWNDKEYERRKKTLASGTDEEINDFAQEFLQKYSDPDDKAEVLMDVAWAYEAKGQFRDGLKWLRKKMELFGADTRDYLLTAGTLDLANDSGGMKRELREGIMFGVRKFAKENPPERRETASALGEMFDRLQDRQAAAQWFDISLAPDPSWYPNTAERWTESHLKTLPKWYQSERSARGKNETDVARLVRDDPESYLNRIRNRWLSQNEEEIVALMRPWGLSDDLAKQLLKTGIDAIPPSWWEQELRPRITVDEWSAVRAKLDERKSL